MKYYDVRCKNIITILDAQFITPMLKNESCMFYTRPIGEMVLVFMDVVILVNSLIYGWEPIILTLYMCMCNCNDICALSFCIFSTTCTSM